MSNNEATFMLICRALDEGDTQAVKAIQSGYGRLIRSWVRQKLRPHLAMREEVLEEVCQDVWRKVWQAIGPDSGREVLTKFQSLGHILKYFKQTSYASAWDANNKSQPSPPPPKTQGGKTHPESSENCPAPDTTLESSEDALRVQQTVEKRITDPREKLYIRLRFIEGYTSTEIAKLYPEQFPGGRNEVYSLGEGLIKRIRRWFPGLNKKRLDRRKASLEKEEEEEEPQK